MDNVTLIGMPGSGKSTIGVVLAKVLGYEFLDVDLVIQRRQGARLQALLDRFGQQAFLDMERDAILSLDCRCAVIAPGGSCVLRAPAMERLKSLGQVVYLRLPYPQLERRIHNLKDRGIAFAPGQTLLDVYRQRVPLYERWADHIVDCEGHTTEDTLAAVLGAIS